MNKMTKSANIGAADAQRFMSETYPKLWHLAFNEGYKARDNGHPKICNLQDVQFGHFGQVLKPYVSAWHQGYETRDNRDNNVNIALINNSTIL